MAGLLTSVLVLLVGTGAVVTSTRRPGADPVQGSAGSTGTPGSTGGSTVGSDPRTAAAALLLGRLGARLEDGTRRDVVSLAAAQDSPARRELATLRRNVRALRMTDLTLTYLMARDQRPARRTWVGEVQVSWRLPGMDTETSRTQVAMTFRWSDGEAGFVTARATRDAAVPLWMLGGIVVARTPRSVVVSDASGAPAEFSRLADQAVTDVRKVLRGWSGRLVVEVPRDQRQLNRVLGARPGAYSAIAALTTTADGSFAESSPVHVFVNRRVFEPLGPRGSQIVMSHEATHVAVDAALSTMPIWLLEGFADYVALAHVALPVSRLASQVLAQVRRSGPPARLPGGEEFAPDVSRLGASYESAWLACRLIAERYGERRLIALYRAADRAPATAVPFRAVLGTSQAAFTRLWQDDLRRRARAGTG